jgi:hypothetical protein
MFEIDLGSLGITNASQLKITSITSVHAGTEDFYISSKASGLLSIHLEDVHLSASEVAFSGSGPISFDTLTHQLMITGFHPLLV